MHGAPTYPGHRDGSHSAVQSSPPHGFELDDNARDHSPQSFRSRQDSPMSQNFNDQRKPNLSLDTPGFGCSRCGAPNHSIQNCPDSTSTNTTPINQVYNGPPPKRRRIDGPRIEGHPTFHAQGSQGPYSSPRHSADFPPRERIPSYPPPADYWSRSPYPHPGSPEYPPYTPGSGRSPPLYSYPSDTSHSPYHPPPMGRPLIRSYNSGSRAPPHPHDIGAGPYGGRSPSTGSYGPPPLESPMSRYSHSPLSAQGSFSPNHFRTNRHRYSPPYGQLQYFSQQRLPPDLPNISPSERQRYPPHNEVHQGSYAPSSNGQDPNSKSNSIPTSRRSSASHGSHEQPHPQQDYKLTTEKDDILETDEEAIGRLYFDFEKNKIHDPAYPVGCPLPATYAASEKIWPLHPPSKKDSSSVSKYYDLTNKALTIKTISLTYHWDELSKDPVFRYVPDECEMVPIIELKKKRRWQRFSEENIVPKVNGYSLISMDETPKEPVDGSLDPATGYPIPISGEHSINDSELKKHHKDETEERLALLGVTGEPKPRVWRGPAKAPVEMIPVSKDGTNESGYIRGRDVALPKQDRSLPPTYQNFSDNPIGSEYRSAPFNGFADRPRPPPPLAATPTEDLKDSQRDISNSTPNDSTTTHEPVSLLRARSLKYQPPRQKSRSRSNSQERRRQADDDVPKRKRKQPKVAAAYGRRW